MIRDFIYDIETYENVFLVSFEHADALLTWSFEISEFQDDRKELLQFFHWLKQQNARMVGFNNIGFDYPVIHMFLKTGGYVTPKQLCEKASAIIEAQSDEFTGNRWTHQIYPSDRFIEQLDLYLIHHFDNNSKRTSLKVLEFNMRSDMIVDLPFPVGSILTREQIEVLKRYNQHDVSETKKFYHHTLKMIQFREELTRKYNRDFMNHNDTKIGKDYFIMKLQEAGVECYDYTPDKGRSPRQTKRPMINLRDAILPWIQFEHPELNRVLQWFKEQSITNTKDELEQIVPINGFAFTIKLGGAHASVEKKVIESDADNIIIDLDVSSYYPNLAIQNGFHPAHLGKKFVDIYRHLYEQRKQYPKKSTESEMLKLALNGTYGDSNNKFSVFYDPLFMMQITMNGQFLLLMLAEQLMKIPGLTMIQANTDGLTVRLPRASRSLLDSVTSWWQGATRLTLESTAYKAMYIRDVNNYLAVPESGPTKRKGVYEWKLGADSEGFDNWHQNASCLVVPKVAEKVLTEGASIRKTIEVWPDIMDFMLRTKVPRTYYLSWEFDGRDPQQIQRVSRYYLANTGGKLFKHMPPIKDNPTWRKVGIHAGWDVQVCNDIRDIGPKVNLDWYIREVEKLCNTLS